MLLYLAQEGRGIGLLNKLRAYELQEQGLDTVEANLALGFPADAREYGIGSQILADLGLTTIRVLTNNPKKITGIAGFGLTVVSQEPIEIEPNDENRRYLETKREKLGHTAAPPGSALRPGARTREPRRERPLARVARARTTRPSRSRSAEPRQDEAPASEVEAPVRGGRRRSSRAAEQSGRGERRAPRRTAEPAARARRGRLPGARRATPSSRASRQGGAAPSASSSAASTAT